MEIEHVHHIGKVVKNLDEEAATFKQLGFEVSEIKLDSAQKVKIRLAKKGEVIVELLEPLGADSPIANAAPGLHHICFCVQDIEKYLVQIKENNFGFQLTKPTKSIFNGRRVAFFGTPNKDIYEVIES